MKKLLVLVVLLAGCGYAGNRGYDWYNAQLHDPTSPTSQRVAFHIDQGESTAQIASDLQTRGLISSPEVFQVYMKYMANGAQLEAGDFTLDKHMSMLQIITALGSAKVQQLTVTLPEGSTAAAMSQVVGQSGLGTADQYVAAVKDPTWQYPFLQSRPATAPANLEGFLFPDTYQLDKGATPHELVKRQLDRFTQQVSPAMQAQMAQAVPGRPAESLYNIITLASIVEREVQKDPDRAIVCGIFYNRLSIGMALQDDVTVLYGLGKLQGPLTDQDKQRDTPYNTYLHPGLPAGPISNPGIATINACITPQKSAFFYFFADAKGVTRYARTYAEHLQQQTQYGLAPG
jgi:UPF0755 protein